MRSSALVPAVVVLIGVATATVAMAGAARFSTEAYLGAHTDRTQITEYRPRHWDINCYAYSNGWVNTSPRRHKLIYAHTMDSYIVGVGRLRPNGRWSIWDRTPFSDKPDVRVGTVVRRSATRWDILRRGRKIGFAVGPDGPEAATALLTVCQL